MSAHECSSVNQLEAKAMNDIRSNVFIERAPQNFSSLLNFGVLNEVFLKLLVHICVCMKESMCRLVFEHGHCFTRCVESASMAATSEN